MTVQIPTGFAAVSAEMRCATDPDPWFVTWAVDISDSGGDIAQVGAVNRNAFDDSIKQILNNTITVVAIHIRVGEDGGPPAIAVFPDGDPGVAAQNMLPQNCAMLVDKFTALPGRQGRGRMFVPGCLDESKVSEVGIIQSAERGSLQLQVDKLLEELAEPVGMPAGTVGTPMVLLHNDVPGGAPPPTPVTSLTVQSVISTQRRRLR